MTKKKYGLNYGLPVIESGDKILCPRCYKHVYTASQDLRYGDTVKARHFEATEGVPQLVDHQAAMTVCCGVAWMINGSLHTNKGWMPYDPYGSRLAQHEKDLLT